MSTALTLTELAEVALFQGFDEAELSELLNVLQVREHTADTALFEAGSETRSLFVLLSGTVRITMVGEVLEETLLLDLNPREVFGEATFFHAVPHTATAVCLSNVRLAVLDRADFDALRERRVLAAFHLAANAAEILSARLHHADQMIREILAAEKSVHLQEARQHYQQHFRHSFGMPRGFYS